MLVFIYHRSLHSFPHSCENLKTRRSNKKQLIPKCISHSVEYSLSPEANSYSAIPEISRLLLNPYVDYHVHKNSQKDLILSQINLDISALLVCDAASLDIWFPTIQGLKISKAKYPVLPCNIPKNYTSPT